MLRGLAGRVGRLESGREEPCPECGGDGDPSKVDHAVEWQDADAPVEPDVFCETCGFQLTCTVHATWDDFPSTGKMRGGGERKERGETWSSTGTGLQT
jgi:hypothetical protein